MYLHVGFHNLALHYFCETKQEQCSLRNRVCVYEVRGFCPGFPRSPLLEFISDVNSKPESLREDLPWHLRAGKPLTAAGA